MTDKKQPEALELASAAESADIAGYPTAKKANAYCLCLLEDCAQMIRRLHAENESLRAERERNLDSIRVNNEIINKKLDENETLRTGYAAARLEIESLRTRCVEPVGERTTKDYAIEHAEYMAQDAEHQPPGNHGEKPLPLLARDIAADFGVTPVQVCLALVELGFGHLSVNMAITPEMAEKLREYFAHAAQQAPAQAAPAAVAGPSEFPHAQMDAMALARYKVVPSHESMFHRHAVAAGDGSQQLYIGREVECENMARKFAGAFLDGAFAFHLMLDAAPTTQPAAQQEPGKAVHQFRKQHCADWYDGHADHGDGRGPYEERTLYTSPQQEVQEPVAWYVTGCGRLLDEYDAEAEARRIGGTAKAMPLYTVPQPSPASQGDALDAEQHEIDARHAAIYRWMLSHVADVLSIFDNWFADEEADTDELHDALAARAAQEGK